MYVHVPIEFSSLYPMKSSPIRLRASTSLPLVAVPVLSHECSKAVLHFSTLLPWLFSIPLRTASSTPSSRPRPSQSLRPCRLLLMAAKSEALSRNGPEKCMETRQAWKGKNTTLLGKDGKRETQEDYMYLTDIYVANMWLSTHKPTIHCKTSTFSFFLHHPLLKLSLITRMFFFSIWFMVLKL